MKSLIATIIISATCIFGIALLGAEKNEGKRAFKPRPMKLEIPKGWPKPEKNVFDNNPLTVEGFMLGKRLFYDGNLSKDGQVSCASCHQQFAAFATFDHDLSHGVANTLTTRNAPGLFNLAWKKEMHWDGGVNHLEVQPLNPMTAPNEMGETLDNIVAKVKSDTAYRRFFVAAFGSQKVNMQRILKALAQFTGSIVSANSKYDKVMRGEAVFTAYELKGYELFKQKCAGCHREPLFTDNSFRNNGMPMNRFKDIGRQAITLDPTDSLKFIVPSLRNAQLTFPYMHDGSIYSIPQVIEHYRSKMNTADPNLDPLLRGGIHLSLLEKNQLTYFIYTLTDSSLTKDKKYAPDNGIIMQQTFDNH